MILRKNLNNPCVAEDAVLDSFITWTPIIFRVFHDMNLWVHSLLYNSQANALKLEFVHWSVCMLLEIPTFTYSLRKDTVITALY